MTTTSSTTTTTTETTKTTTTTLKTTTQTTKYTFASTTQTTLLSTTNTPIYTLSNITKGNCSGVCGIGRKNVTQLCFENKIQVPLEKCGIHPFNYTETCELPNKCKEGKTKFVSDDKPFCLRVRFGLAMTISSI